MDGSSYEIAGKPSRLAAGLAHLLPGAMPCGSYLINADEMADAHAVTARCRAFADRQTGQEDTLIVTILSAAQPGMDHADAHQAAAALWAFTRLAALQWAPRRVRVNAIGLGVSPAGPFEPQEQAGRAAFGVPTARPAALEDIVRTIRAMAAWRSMTGQIIRLGV